MSDERPPAPPPDPAAWPPPYPGAPPGFSPPSQGAPYPGASYPAPFLPDAASRHSHPSGPAPGAPYPPGPPAQWAVAPPRPLSNQPRHLAPRRSSAPTAVLTVIAVALLGLVAALAFPYLESIGLPDRRPSQSAPTTKASAPTPGASGPASSKPTPTATMPADPKVLLRKNPIYALAVPAKCPAQNRPASKAAWRKQVRALVNCANAAWKKALAATPVKFDPPDVEFYDTRATSACGRLGDSFPAAYCGTEQTLYFSSASYRQGRYYRLAVAQFVMHEYAHHVQQLADISPTAHDGVLDEKTAVTTRRIELQAHCMAHYQLTHSQLGFDASDRADAEFQFTYTSDPNGHGSTAAERYWGRRGLDASTIGACNTWKVKAGKVT